MNSSRKLEMTLGINCTILIHILHLKLVVMFFQIWKSSGVISGDLGGHSIKTLHSIWLSGYVVVVYHQERIM